MSDLQKYKAKQMEDPEFRKEYETMRPELEVTRALIAARIAQHMTQEELSQKSGVRQSNISRIESGTSSPTIDTLSRIAAGLGKKLVIEFQ